MTEIEKMKRYIDRTKKFPEGTPYQMNLLEVFTLNNTCKNDPYEMICLAFNYGRAKGYRAAKAEGRAKS